MKSNSNICDISFPALSENEAFARMAVSAFVMSGNPTLEELSDIKTAVSEAVTNSIVHAYEKNNGEIRVFSVIAFFSAMILYNTIFGLFVEKILGKTALAIKKIMLAAAECVAMPFKLVWHICRRPAVKARNKVKKTGYAVLILIKKYVKIKMITFRALLRPGKK